MWRVHVLSEKQHRLSLYTPHTLAEAYHHSQGSSELQPASEVQSQTGPVSLGVLCVTMATSLTLLSKLQPTHLSYAPADDKALPFQRSALCFSSEDKSQKQRNVISVLFFSL